MRYPISQTVNTSQNVWKCGNKFRQTVRRKAQGNILCLTQYIPRSYIIFRPSEDQWCTKIIIMFGLQTGNHSESSSGQNWRSLKNKTKSAIVKELAYSLKSNYKKVPQLLSFSFQQIMPLSFLKAETQSALATPQLAG